jgi:flagellin
MGFRIQNNIAAMNAQRNLGVADSGLSKSLERLSSGFRINTAKDDAAGLAISQQFRADIASAKVSQRNISEANALLQTAEGAMNSVGDILTRMKELATQAASANAGTDITKVNAEYNTLVLEIDRIADSTKYAGVQLTNGNFTAGNTSTTWAALANIYEVNVTNATAGNYTVAYSATSDGLTLTNAAGTISETRTLTAGAQTVNFGTFGISFKTTGAAVADTVGAALEGANGGTFVVAAGANSKDFQVGYKNDGYSKMGVSIDSITSTALSLATDDISTLAKAQAAMTKIDSAVSALSTSRAEIGSYQNRLAYAASNLATTLENFTAAESVIRDVDMAAEMTSFTKNQILVQAGVSMLAQANMSPQMVMSLFK